MCSNNGDILSGQILFAVLVLASNTSSIAELFTYYVRNVMKSENHIENACVNVFMYVLGFMICL